MQKEPDCNDGRGVKPARLLSYLIGKSSSRLFKPSGENYLIGVLDGNGIGPEVLNSTLRILAAVEAALGLSFQIRRGGLIGEAAEAEGEKSLPDSVTAFCGEIFAGHGAVLSGPGGGRYVYDLRRQFDLFCKFVPVCPWPQLAGAGKIAAAHLQQVDMLLVRDNTGGVYQGQWENRMTPEGHVAEHSFGYSEQEVYRLVEVATRAATNRRGTLHIIVKDGGVPGISALWRDVAVAVARKYSVRPVVMNVDLAAYELIQHPAQFDVLVAPNLIGDILADLAGVLVASRGLTFSGNYNPEGHGVYQTNHGCAHDLAGTDRANPAGQILSLAMLLRESFGLAEAATLIETALAETWHYGWRTDDIVEPGCRTIGTNAMTDRIIEQVLRFAEASQPA
jgi:3-isopropylmalate dehydrogenase